MRTEERERVIKESGYGGESIRRLSKEIEIGIRSVGRWIKKAVCRAPVLGAKVIRLCYEFRPSLPLSRQSISGPMSAREHAGWFVMWGEMGGLTVGRIDGKRTGGLAAVSIVGSLIEESFAYRRC